MTQPDNIDTRVELVTWLATLQAELGVDIGAVDINLLLDVTRDVAHNVARPAGPLTTYVIGYAAGMAAAHNVARALGYKATYEVEVSAQDLDTTDLVAQLCAAASSLALGSSTPPPHTTEH